MRRLRFTIAALFPAVLLAETHTLTLRQTLELAQKQSPDIVLARFEEIKAQQAVRTARDPFLPRIVAGSGIAYSSGFPLSIDGSAPSVIRADAAQTLFDRQKTWELERAREDARGAVIGVQGRHEEALHQVANAYLDADRLRRSVEIARTQAASLGRVLEIVQVRAAEGRELEVESKKAAARLAQAEHNVRVFDSQLSYAEESLALLAGFPTGDRLRPATEERTSFIVPASEQEAAADAVANSIELRSLQSKLQASGFEIKASHASRYPKVNLVAQYGLLARYNNYEDFFRKFQRHNGQVGVSFQIPLLTGPAAAARAAQAQAESSRLQLEINHRRDRIALETRRLFADLKTAESLREALRLDLEAAREQVTVILAQFDEGRSGLRQVEEARFEENQKWASYVDAQISVERLRIALLKETGGLLAALR